MSFVSDFEMTVLEKFLWGDAECDSVLDPIAITIASPPVPKIMSQCLFIKYCLFDNTYFYTLTLRPEFHAFPLNYQHELFQRDLDKYLRKRKIPYYLVPELTEQGNLHLHGIIMCDYETSRKLMNRWIKMSFGFYKAIYPIKSPIALYEYIHKDKLYEKPVYPIISYITY